MAAQRIIIKNNIITAYAYKHKHMDAASQTRHFTFRNSLKHVHEKVGETPV